MDDDADTGLASEAADVVVIGGGPAGSAVALRLARQGLRVIQVERRIFLDPRNDHLRSGEGVLPSTRRELATLGIDAETAPWRCSRIRQVRIYWPDGAQTTNSIARRGGIIQIDREYFDYQLFCAARQAGVDGREGWQARRFVRDARGRVSGVVVQPPAGQPPCVLRAPIVVDAGGRNALALRELNLRVPEADADFFVISMFFDQVADLAAEVWEMHMFGAEQLAVVQLSRISEGVVRCGLGMTYQAKRAAHCSPQDFFWSRIQHDPELARRLAGSRIVHRPFVRAGLGYRVRQIAFDSLLLVGDATGYLNPLFGDGILRALVTARRAADTVGQALRDGDCSRSALARYARRRGTTQGIAWFAKRLLLHMHDQPRALSLLGHMPLVRRALLAALMRG